MNFGQALGILMHAGTISCPELGRPGSYLAMQEPAGGISKPFIVLEAANGERVPWSPTQDAILSTGWTQVNAADANAGNQAATRGQQQETHASR